MKFAKILIFVLGLLNISCNKNNQPNDPGSITEIYPKKIWSVVTPAATKIGLSHTEPIIYKDLVVIDQETSDSVSNYQYIWAYDRLTGEKKWDVQYKGISPFMDSYSYNNIAVYSSGAIISAINLDNGHKLWTKNNSGYAALNGFKNSLLHTQDYSTVGGPWADSSSVFITDILSGKSQKVFTVKRKGTFCPGMAIPTLWFNEMRDSILFFQDRGIHDAAGFKQRVDLYSYNINKKKMEWKIDSIEDNSSIVSNATIYNGKLYFCGMKYIYCLNPSTGALIWKWKSTEQNASMPTGKWFFEGNKIIVKPLCGITYALNTDSGSVLWTNRQSFGTDARNMVVYKKRLYQSNWGDGLINILDIDTGIESNKLKVASANAIAIDQSNGYLYFHDYVRLNCYKVAKE